LHLGSLEPHVNETKQDFWAVEMLKLTFIDEEKPIDIPSQRGIVFSRLGVH